MRRSPKESHFVIKVERQGYSSYRELKVKEDRVVMDGLPNEPVGDKSTKRVPT